MAVLNNAGCHHRESGSVTLEFALTLSALTLVVVCGTLLIALVGVKTELSAVAFEAARADAVSEVYGSHLVERVVSGFWPLAAGVGRPDILTVEHDALGAKVELTLPIFDSANLRAQGVAAR